VRRMWVPILTLALASSLCFGQSKALVQGRTETIKAKLGSTVEVRLPLELRQGFHVNSNTPSEDYLIPLKLTWTEPGALQGGEVSYPKPTLERYEFSPKPLSVFTGNFELTARFKIAPAAQAGPGMAVGKLRYQACNNKACFPPKTIEVRVPYQIQ